MTTYKVYINKNGKAVYSGNVTAETYEQAKQIVRDHKIKDEDFMLITLEETE